MVEAKEQSVNDLVDEISRLRRRVSLRYHLTTLHAWMCHMF